MELEERVRILEHATIIMRDLVVSHDERLEDYFRALRESREDFNFKLNALIDAQIRSESDTAELKESINELKESINELRISSSDLKEASQSQLQRIITLENKSTIV